MCNEHTSEGGRDDRGVPCHAESALSSPQVKGIFAHPNSQATRKSHRSHAATTTLNGWHEEGGFSRNSHASNSQVAPRWHCRHTSITNNGRAWMDGLGKLNEALAGWMDLARRDEEPAARVPRAARGHGAPHDTSKSARIRPKTKDRPPELGKCKSRDRPRLCRHAITPHGGSPAGRSRRYPMLRGLCS